VPGLRLRQSLHGCFSTTIEPPSFDGEARLCTKLRFREMLEPTDLWEEESLRGIKPLHDAIVHAEALRRGLSLKEDVL